MDLIASSSLQYNPILIATGVCVSSCLSVRPRQITSHVADKFERREEVLRETACPFKVFRRRREICSWFIRPAGAYSGMTRVSSDTRAREARRYQR